MPKPKRVLSGMRPTGRLHLGHYFGALSNWLKLQKEYDCYFFVADWHALTTHYEDTSSIAENTLQVAMDWLAVGLDPQKSTLFVQSQVLEHAELHVLLSMITPLSWLERVPTYKEQIENLKGRDLGTYGFLGYPLLQSADIVMYGEPKKDLLVPVGEDQAPHVELTREVVRRFNYSLRVRNKDALFDDLGALTRIALKLVPFSFRRSSARNGHAGRPVRNALRHLTRGVLKRASQRKAARELDMRTSSKKLDQIENSSATGGFTRTCIFRPPKPRASQASTAAAWPNPTATPSG